LRSDQLDLRYADVLPDVVGMPCQLAGNAIGVPVGMVRGGLTVAYADCAYDLYQPCAVFSELCILSVNDHERDRDDCRARIAVFTAGQLSAAAGAAVKLFPVAGCDSGRVYDVNPVGERVL